MKLRVVCLALLSAFAAGIVSSPPAQAQRARVFVSVNGTDSGQCQATEPCRTFAFAQSAVLAGGEISVLDTGGYGTISITKALSIVAPPGVEASIAVTSGITAVTVNAGDTDLVSLRGLTIDGQGVGASGIIFNTGASLTVVDCVVRNMTQDGLLLQASGAAAQKLVVSNSYFYDNGGTGVDLLPQGNHAVTVEIDHVGTHHNTAGIFASGNSVAGGSLFSIGVSDSVAANNSTAGFWAQSGIRGVAFITRMSLTRVQSVGNGIGFEASNASTDVWLAQSTATGNAAGFSQSGSTTIASFGDNYFSNNGGDTGSLSSATKQ